MNSLSLEDQRCGYPVGPCVNKPAGHKQDYEHVQQQFEGGLARLVVDDTSRTLEGLYRRNVNEDIWFPA